MAPRTWGRMLFLVNRRVTASTVAVTSIALAGPETRASEPKSRRGGKHVHSTTVPIQERHNTVETRPEPSNRHRTEEGLPNTKHRRRGKHRQRVAVLGGTPSRRRPRDDDRHHHGTRPQPSPCRHTTTTGRQLESRRSHLAEAGGMLSHRRAPETFADHYQDRLMTSRNATTMPRRHYRSREDRRRGTNRRHRLPKKADIIRRANGSIRRFSGRRKCLIHHPDRGRRNSARRASRRSRFRRINHRQTRLHVSRILHRHHVCRRETRIVRRQTKR